LIAAGNVGSTALAPLVAAYADADDDVLSDAAGWALAQIAGRSER
jgi:hypothetical protein